MIQVVRVLFEFEFSDCCHGGSDLWYKWAFRTLSEAKKCVFMQFQYPHSRTIHHFRNSQARLAQSVEHQTFNLRVAGSSPSSGGEILKNEKL